MNYNEIGTWTKGYIDALMECESISKPQIEKLISRLKEMIQEIEKNELDQIPDKVPESILNDDLPY